MSGRKEILSSEAEAWEKDDNGLPRVWLSE
jgi:hypothetical protein